MAVQSFFVILNPPKAGEELPSVVGILRPAKGGIPTRGPPEAGKRAGIDIAV